MRSSWADARHFSLLASFDILTFIIPDHADSINNSSLSSLWIRISNIIRFFKIS